MIKLILPFLFSLSLHAEPNYDPDVEVKIKGLVCSSCAIGVKKGLNKTKLIKKVKFDTRKQLCIIEYISIEIHPSEINKIVKDAGYQVTYIKWLKNKKHNRYNKP